MKLEGCTTAAEWGLSDGHRRGDTRPTHDYTGISWTPTLPSLALRPSETERRMVREKEGGLPFSITTDGVTLDILLSRTVSFSGGSPSLLSAQGVVTCHCCCCLHSTLGRCGAGLWCHPLHHSRDVPRVSRHPADTHFSSPPFSWHSNKRGFSEWGTQLPENTHNLLENWPWVCPYVGIQPMEALSCHSSLLCSS